MGGEDVHLVFAAGETGYSKKLGRYFIDNPRYFGETTTASQKLDDSLNSNVTWTESDCAEDRTPQ